MKRASLKNEYGDWAVVTGASDGIGRAFARSLAERGLNLVLAARREAVLNDLAGDLSQKFAIETRCLSCDLSREEGTERLVLETEGLDVGLLVAAAGFGTSGSFVYSNIDDELGMIDLNCRALAAAAYHFGKRFKERGSGGMILMSSIVAFQGVPRSANYAATKAYAQSLAEGLHVELKPFGVDVLAAAPGPVESGFAARAGMQMGGTDRPEAVAKVSLAALGKRSLTRPGFLSKFLGYSLAMLPRWGRRRVMTLVMAGMTKGRK